MIARTSRLAVAAAVTLAILAGCPPPKQSANHNIGDGTEAESTPGANANTQAKPILRLAGVEEFEIVVLESEPVQVRVVVYGWMSDACTTIRDFEQSREGSLIRLKIITTRPADVMCAQMIKRFRETFPLETGDLAPGTYTLDVNGKTQEFTLP